jgi:ABC-type glycerol-3-phosphate transport system substrate-binding protein
MKDRLAEVKNTIVLFLQAVILLLVYSACSSQPTLTPTIEPTPANPTPTSSPLPPTPTADPRPTSTEVPDAQGTVQVWLDWTTGEIQALTQHLNEFRELFPSVQIEIAYHTPDEILESYRVAVLDGSAPDILVGDASWGRDLFAEGMIRNITDRIAPEMIELVHPVAWDGVRKANSTFGLPFSIQGIVLYRNPNIVSTPATSIEAIAQSLDELEIENKVGANVELGFLYTGAYFSTCEAEFLDLDGQLAMTGRDIECWLRLLQTFGEAGSGTQNSDEDLEAFLAGNSAWLVDGSWHLDDFLDEFGEEGIAIDPWPVYAELGRKLAGYAWTRNIYFSAINTNTEFDAAWVFARYLLTEEVQSSIAQDAKGRQLPVLHELSFETRWLQEMMDAMRENIAIPQEAIYALFSEELEPAAFDVVRRKYDPYWSSEWAMLNIVKALTFWSGNGQ